MPWYTRDLARSPRNSIALDNMYDFAEPDLRRQVVARAHMDARSAASNEDYERG